MYQYNSRNQKKKLGIGTLSLLLFGIGIFFSFTLEGQGAFGDKILNWMNVRAWSGDFMGIHYTVFYAIVFYITSILIGHFFKNDIGAKLGKNLSIAMTVILVGLATIFLFLD